jgi:hypothetical protein
MLSTDLLKHIRTERVQKKNKQPFRGTLFGRVSGLVRQHALGEDFLTRLDDFTGHLSRENLTPDRERAKEPFEPPLFALSTEEEYRVTVTIMKRVNNPYLHFVNSPEEILLCGPLFARNPSLEPDKLASRHFETLLLRELAEEDPRDFKPSSVNRGGEK